MPQIFSWRCSNPPKRSKGSSGDLPWCGISRVCFTWWYVNEAQAYNSSNPRGKSQHRGRSLFALICSSDQIDVCTNAPSGISYVINFNVGLVHDAGSDGWAAVGAGTQQLGAVICCADPAWTRLHLHQEASAALLGSAWLCRRAMGGKCAALVSEVAGVTRPVGMFMVWPLKSALVWGRGCRSLAFRAFGKDQLRFSLCLCLFVLNWQQICRLMSPTGCHGAWPGAVMRQVSGLCWIMQRGSAWTAQCHALALNQGRRDWRGLSESLSNPSVGPMMEEPPLF